MNTSNLHTYQTDILGEDYQQLTLNFADDYDGKVVATLIRKKAHNPTKKLFCIFMVLLIIFFKLKWLKNLINMVMTFMRST
jgi:hypothetical protein